MQRTIGVKRRMPLPRASVSAAVGLCGQDNLTDEQRGRLARFASALGVAAPADGDLCAALEEALGDEWAVATESLALLVAQERRAEKSREMLSEMRSQRVRRGFFGTPQVEQPDEVPSEIWSALPPELQPVVVEQLVRTNPRMAILLSETGTEGLDVLTHNWIVAPTVDDAGALVPWRLRLLDYARLAAALGERDPIHLFLTASLCVLRALADHMIDVDMTNGQPTYKMGRGSAYERLLRNDALSVPRNALGGSVYSAPIELGGRAMTPWKAALSARLEGAAPELDESLMGPLPGDVADRALMWRDWVSAAGDSLVTPQGGPRSPLVARYMSFFGWEQPSVLARTLIGTVAMRNAVGIGATAPPDLDRLRLVDTLDPVALRGIVGDAASPDDVRAWTDLRGLIDAYRTGRIQEAVDSDDRVRGRVLAHIDAEIKMRLPPGACEVIGARSPWPAPTFARLFAPSTFWLVPLPDGDIAVLADLYAPALDEAIAVARGGGL
ncbi:hypothetical protein pqer_cds_1164 [Pandoravirus quercus]|uniref:Uncharacterized protein n=1 Tax=Pandoravirus quercus TaxID=2107709 RepID=A0A2U7UAY1_9VIRU|nr:hypothetical protein pqer_cds_1164 [Pandoravirus quercus]AVK75586.1 hypothetical protein pqer_cds_1164 [Pandoravirus quercus]